MSIQAARAADTELDVASGTTDLTGIGATSSSDLTFDNITYSPTAFTIGSSQNWGTLDDLDSSQVLSISNPNTADTLTLSAAGGGDSVAGSNSSDLLYVASAASLSINGGVAGSGTVTNTISFAVAGNLDIAGAATITSQLSSSNLLTVTGGGTLNLGPASAAATGNSGLTGGFAIQNGTVSLGGATNEPEVDLGSGSAAVTLGGSAGNNATLNFQVPASNVVWDMTIAATGTSTISSSSSGTVTFLTGTFVLNNTLNVADTSTGTLGFRNTITQSGTQGITVATANTGTVNFQGASTYTGGVTIDSGVASFSTTEGSANPASGPFGNASTGGGTVTLGGVTTSSATLTDTGNFNLGNPLVIGPSSGGATRTITSTVTSGSPIVDASEVMTLEANVNAEEDTATSTFGFRNTIGQSGGTYGITIDSNNLGTIDLRGPNTFGGGVTIDAGTVTFNASSTGAITNGPFGTGTVTLGGSTAATTLNGGGAFTIANPITVANSSSTIGINNATSSAAVYSGAISLGSNNLTLASVSGANAGADRIRFGSGGITGSGNITINDAAYTLGTNDGAIQMQGSGSATTWVGNVMITTGVGSLGGTNGVNALGASNTVSVSSGAFFAFTSNTGNTASFGFSPTIAGLTGSGTAYEITSSNQTLNLGGSGSYSFSGAIQNSTTATVVTSLVVGSGTSSTYQTLTGASTYTGATNVGNATNTPTATLELGTGGSLANTVVTVADNATLLALNGTSIGNNATAGAGGTLSLASGSTLSLVDNTIGTFDINQNASFVGTALTLSGANLDLDIGTSGIDTINVSVGSVNAMTGSNIIDLTLDSPLTPGTYTLLNAPGGISDVPGTSFLFSNDSTTEQLGGYNLTILDPTTAIQIEVTPVPEPASMALMGLATLILTRRRRRPIA